MTELDLCKLTIPKPHTWPQIAICVSPLIKPTRMSTDCKHELTMAMSWELLAWAMPKILVVCITSTEKLGSQLAMRDPGREWMDFRMYCHSQPDKVRPLPQHLPCVWQTHHQSGRSDCGGWCVVWPLERLLRGRCCLPSPRPAAGLSPGPRPHWCSRMSGMLDRRCPVRAMSANKSWKHNHNSLKL